MDCMLRITGGQSVAAEIAQLRGLDWMIRFGYKGIMMFKSMQSLASEFNVKNNLVANVTYR